MDVDVRTPSRLNPLANVENKLCEKKQSVEKRVELGKITPEKSLRPPDLKS